MYGIGSGSRAECIITGADWQLVLRRKQELTTGVSLRSESRRMERTDKSLLMSRRCVGWVGFFSFPALNLVLLSPWSRAGPFTSHSEATHPNDSDDDLARGEAGPPVRTSPCLTPFRQAREQRTGAAPENGGESRAAGGWRTTTLLDGVQRRGDVAQV